jgi:hypothetical protein
VFFSSFVDRLQHASRSCDIKLNECSAAISAAIIPEDDELMQLKTGEQ